MGSVILLLTYSWRIPQWIWKVWARNEVDRDAERTKATTDGKWCKRNGSECVVNDVDIIKWWHCIINYQAAHILSTLNIMCHHIFCKHFQQANISLAHVNAPIFNLFRRQQTWWKYIQTCQKHITITHGRRYKQFPDVMLLICVIVVCACVYLFICTTWMLRKDYLKTSRPDIEIVYICVTVLCANCYSMYRWQLKESMLNKCDVRKFPLFIWEWRTS